MTRTWLALAAILLAYLIVGRIDMEAEQITEAIAAERTAEIVAITLRRNLHETTQ